MQFLLPSLHLLCTSEVLIDPILLMRKGEVEWSLLVGGDSGSILTTLLQKQFSRSSLHRMCALSFPDSWEEFLLRHPTLLIILSTYQPVYWARGHWRVNRFLCCCFVLGPSYFLSCHTHNSLPRQYDLLEMSKEAQSLTFAQVHTAVNGLSNSKAWLYVHFIKLPWEGKGTAIDWAVSICQAFGIFHLDLRTIVSGVGITLVFNGKIEVVQVGELKSHG